ncbi:aspartate carbamoyltransferase [Porphyromonas levii]|uniref:Aspartate carbamoyltransferase n=1 Tax=Porphyromonas levii TaxID=28114 RepID=A0A4Y8WPR4_9PORP|nr:aspartate carbamoyltransferase [Porphyromonas levii]MBR8702990.1 Aspartate carbamoyltransferase catalytic subunit [Porphyromonas levii]MBR8713782.1 Aspartate carbamoyltransferase catalytic subunit [Porphyromonas levii]MBR8715795.1 Aspartate carbamoyltransferase catalytic subunit [Porphyromonas levii]MBR8728343.1 Aspartate carbamoyltransferase catalytic subunit [Porphyromonas levii]MBR8729112.1 Aspartate carbamoyltransferase catalytic subunit [Porphyromonas levii]
MNKASFYSIEQLTAEQIIEILDSAELFEQNPNRDFLHGRVVATLFFEPSTRTRLSFETAVNRLGGRVIGFSDAKNTSSVKGETLRDTIQMVSGYADLIVMRHNLEGAALYASEVSRVPIINAGDGANQHPSQTMLDLYSIRKTQGDLNNLHITMVGDLKYGRTVHSLIEGTSHFNPTFSFVAPRQLELPREYVDYCAEHGIEADYHNELTSEVIAKSDIVYMTRLQRERFLDEEDYQAVKDSFVLDNSLLQEAKPTMKILHPLPRVNEIAQEVDDTPYAYYFRQAVNGMFVREALICRALGIEVSE